MPAPVAMPPHAYVVEARPLDRCAPPACSLGTESVSGIAGGGSAGAYLARGDASRELFARRGTVLAPGASYSFRVERSDAASRLDFAVASAEASGGDYRAELRIDDERGRALASRTVSGTSAAWRATAPLDARGRDEDAWTRVRQDLAGRDAGPIVVAIRNAGGAPLALAAPTVARRVEGRAPRQAIFVVFDAVPWPALGALFAGQPAPNAASELADRGATFLRGVSPGQLTGSFVRRFFKGRFFALDGDPSLAGQGFDETPPPRALGPIARLAEQGFVTSALASNLYLSPALSRIGFDEDYDIESTLDLQDHPRVLARRFAAWMDAYEDQDFATVVWFASTHAPWRDVKPDVPPVGAPGLDEAALDRGVLDPVWRNLVDTSESLSAIAARVARAPAAHRVWLVATDHGHTFTREARERPWRLPHESVESGHMHCCLATQQEARTPFVVAEETPGAPRPRAVRHVGPASTMLAWRRVERAFGVDLNLPDTTTFREPDERGDDAFDDGVLVSVGDSGALAAVRGSLAYRSYRPKLDLDAIRTASPAVARMLAGSPRATSCALAEELYDTAADSAETHDLACERWDDLLELRARTSAWTSEWADPIPHTRWRFRLDFASEARVALHAPREFGLSVGGAEPVRSPPVATVSASRIDLADRDEPLGVVDLGGEAVASGLVVRCSASGLPLAVLDAAHPRLDLALAAANCPGEPRDARPARGEAWFSATRTETRSATASAGAPDELRQALRRWGYVR